MTKIHLHEKAPPIADLFVSEISNVARVSDIRNDEPLCTRKRLSSSDKQSQKIVCLRCEDSLQDHQFQVPLIVKVNLENYHAVEHANHLMYSLVIPY